MPLAISGRKAATTEYEKSRRSRFLAKALAFLIMMLILFPVFAADYNTTPVKMFDYISGYSAEAGKDVEKVIAVDFSGEVSTINGIDISSLTKDGGVIESLNEICMGVALALSIAMFCVSLMQAYLNGTVSDEAWLQKFIILGMTIIGIVYARQLTMLVATLGSGIAERVISEDLSKSPAMGDITTFRNQMIESITYKDATSIERLCDNMKAWGISIGYTFTFALPYAAVLICNIVVWLQAWSRAIEILIIAAMSPFGFLGIERGMDGPVRYVKQVFVLGIQGAIMMAIIVICKTLSATALAGIVTEATTNVGMENFWGLIIINFVEVGMLQRSRQIAQSIVT